MLTLEITGFNHKPVFDAGFQRVGRCPCNGGVQAADARAVGKVLRWHRIGFRNQVPDRVRIFVGLNVAQWNDFDACELQSSIEAKDDWIDQRIVGSAFAAEHGCASRPGPVINLNMIPGKPVFVEVKRKAAEQDGDRQP